MIRLLAPLFVLFLCGAIVFLPFGLRYLSIPVFRACLWFASAVMFAYSLIIQIGQYLIVVPLLRAAFGLARGFRPPIGAGIIVAALIVWAVDAFFLYGRIIMTIYTAGEFALISLLFLVVLLTGDRASTSPKQPSTV